MNLSVSFWFFCILESPFSGIIAFDESVVKRVGVKTQKLGYNYSMLRKALFFSLFVFVFSGLGLAGDLRALKIQKFLTKYPGSPLRGHVHEILYCADHFGLDYRLYLGLAGAESTFGRRYLKSSRNLTGICNGGARFASIYDNIYRTHEIIATGKWYKKYRATRELKDLVYVYKGAPPYERYLRTLRAILAGIDRASVAQPARVDPLVAWNTVPYDKYTCRKTAPLAVGE